jgi:hypothetical protein
MSLKGPVFNDRSRILLKLRRIKPIGGLCYKTSVISDLSKFRLILDDPGFAPQGVFAKPEP